jgi:hypothetical protein
MNDHPSGATSMLPSTALAVMVKTAAPPARTVP